MNNEYECRYTFGLTPGPDKPSKPFDIKDYHWEDVTIHICDKPIFGIQSVNYSTKPTTK